MNRPVRLLLLAVLAWQAVAGAWTLLGEAFAGLQRGYGERLTADTDARIRAVLENDHEIYLALREDLPPGAMVLTRMPPPDAGSVRDEPRLRTIDALRHLLYPHPFLPRSLPDPILVAETQVRPGQSVWLLVLPGDPEPIGRPDWVRQRREDRYQIWRLQRP